MAFSYSNADALFDNDTADADGQVVLVRYNDIKTWLNGSNTGPSNVDLTATFPWTGKHNWIVADSANHNRSLSVSSVMAASKYGDYITSAAVQINAPLIYRSLSNASSSVSLEELVNAGTGDTHKVTNSNTGACYHAVTTSTGNPYKATIRTLTDLSASLTSKVITTPTTVANSTTETAVSDATISLPADFLKIGSTIKGTLYGLMATPAAGTATIQIEVKYGGTGGVVLLDTGVITPTASLVASQIKVDFILTCITTGVTGTIEAQGQVSWNSNTAPANRGMGIGATGIANSAALVIDTTLAKDLIISLTWGSAVADCSISIRNGIMELKR